MRYDWLENYEDNTLEPMEMNAEERAQVLTNALGKLEALQKENPGRRKAGKRKLVRWAAALAAVLAAVILTAGAAVCLFDAGELLHWIFGTAETPEQLDGLGVLGSPIGQSQEQGGYTVNLYGAVGDRSSCYLVFDVTAPAGTVLDQAGRYGFQSAELWQTEHSGGPFGYYCTELADDDPTDNVARFMVFYSQEKKMKGQDYTLRLKGFTEYADDHSGEEGWDDEKLLADETWEFSFEMNDIDTSVCIPIRQRMDFRGEEAELYQIFVSPFSIRLEYRQSLVERILRSETGSDTERDGWGQLPQIVLFFADGTEYRLDQNSWTSGMSSSTNRMGMTQISVTAHFQELLKPANLASIEIDGVKFEVS